MDEYISRHDALLHSEIIRVYSKDYGNIDVVPVEYLADIPAADVQPVKHGRWELISQNKFTGTKTLRCTYCKNYFVVRDDTLNAGRGDANFCPNCGSKNRMGGDSE